MMYLGSNLRGGNTCNIQYVHFTHISKIRCQHGTIHDKKERYFTWICLGSLVIRPLLAGCALYVRIVLPIATPRKL